MTPGAAWDAVGTPTVMLHAPAILTASQRTSTGAASAAGLLNERNAASLFSRHISGQ